MINQTSVTIPKRSSPKLIKVLVLLQISEALFPEILHSLSIYKSFIRPKIDYCDFIYDQFHKEC